MLQSINACDHAKSSAGRTQLEKTYHDIEFTALAELQFLRHNFSLLAVKTLEFLNKNLIAPTRYSFLLVQNEADQIQKLLSIYLAILILINMIEDFEGFFLGGEQLELLETCCVFIDGNRIVSVYIYRLKRFDSIGNLRG